MDFIKRNFFRYGLFLFLLLSALLIITKMNAFSSTLLENDAKKRISLAIPRNTSFAPSIINQDNRWCIVTIDADIGSISGITELAGYQYVYDTPVYDEKENKLLFLQLKIIMLGLLYLIKDRKNTNGLSIISLPRRAF